MCRCCCCDMQDDLAAAESELFQIRVDLTAVLADLRRGDINAAIRALVAIAPDKGAELEKKREEELFALFSAWREMPMPRPEFLTFAHKRRKWSAA